MGDYPHRFCINESCKDYGIKVHTDTETVTAAFKMLMEKSRIRGTARALDVDKDSVLRWLDRADKHCDKVCDYFLHELGFTQAQVDEIYTFIQKRAMAKERKAPSGS